MIVEYEERYLPAFARLNLEWIEHYFAVEENDRKIFADPVAKVIAPGGQIFFALDASGEPVGTVAVVAREPGVYELAKMGVTPHAQGQGWGKKLATTAVEWVRRAGGHTMIILSNSRLATALALYERFGFRHAPVPDGHGYERADVYMVLNLRDFLPGEDGLTNGSRGNSGV